MSTWSWSEQYGNHCAGREFIVMFTKLSAHFLVFVFKFQEVLCDGNSSLARLLQASTVGPKVEDLNHLISTLYRTLMKKQMVVYPIIGSRYQYRAWRIHRYDSSRLPSTTAKLIGVMRAHASRYEDQKEQS